MSSTESAINADEVYLNDSVRHGGCSRVAWLAGYPRSGAALVRTILAHCFGHETLSSYSEAKLSDNYRKHLGVFGSGDLAQDGTGGDVYRIADDQGLLTVKTHELPDVADYKVPTIVIVRDARRAFDSLQSWYRQRNKVEIPMEDIITGAHKWGNWSVWIRKWVGFCHPQTLWLRYEDIMADGVKANTLLSRRFGIKPISHAIPSFSTMHATDPDIFRCAATSGNGGMTDDQEDMFWDMHGATMTMLGYYR